KEPLAESVPAQNDDETEHTTVQDKEVKESLTQHQTDNGARMSYTGAFGAIVQNDADETKKLPKVTLTPTEKLKNEIKTLSCTKEEKTRVLNESMEFTEQHGGILNTS